MGGITPLNNAALPEPLREFMRASRSQNTLRCYRGDNELWATWCSERGIKAYPAEPLRLAEWLSEQAQAGIAAVTISRRLAAIRHAHKALSLPPPESPALSAALSGIRRTLGVRSHGKTPLVVDLAKQTLLAIGDTLIDKRDRSLLLLGWSGAMRRSELVALTVEDIEFCPEGLRVHIGHAKGDQESVGVTIAVLAGSTPALCPAAALRAWLDASGITDGPIYRRVSKTGVIGDALKPAAVNAVLKARLKAAGIDPAEFGAHSLRSGFLSSAAENGASVFKMMEVSRHRSVETLKGYLRSADAFRQHAGKGLL